MPVTSDARQAADLGACAQAVADSSELESSFREMLDLLPAAIYITDAKGRLTYFNPACESFSGRNPKLGSDQWCVTWKLYYPDGTPMPHDACPMAVMLKEGRAVRGEQAIAERPDGTRIWFEPYPTPLFDAGGKLIGGINMLVEITGLKQVEAALRKSEQELADFFDNATVALHWVGPDGTILRANQAELDLTGFSRDEYVGRNITEFHADPEAIGDILCKLTAGETLTRHEARLRCKDGSIKHVLIDSNVLWEDGRFVHTRCFTRDITEQKRAEEERADLLCREREARREAEALNDVARAVSGLDLEAVVQKATDAATDLSGAKFGAFFYNVINDEGEAFLLYTLSGAPREVFEKLGLPRNTALFETTFRGEGIVRIADVLADPRYGKNSPWNGMPPGHLPVRSYLAVPVVSSSGEVLGGLFFSHPKPGVFTERSERIVAGIAVHAGIAMDNARLFNDAQREIAERKRIAEALREREHQFAGIFNQTTCGIAQTDLTGRFVLVNDRYCDIVGRPREELLKLRMHDITRPDDLAANADQFRALVEQNGPNYEVEKCYLRPDGSSVWVHNDVAAIRDEEGCVRHLAAAVTDITERKCAEDQLRRSNAELAAYVAEARDARQAALNVMEDAIEAKEALRQSEQRLLEADRRKDEFLATLSHELRNPLAPIRNSVQIMRLAGVDEEAAEQARETIERQVTHLVRLVDDLLDLSRISSNKFELRRERIALAVIVQSAVETSRPLIEACGQELSVSLPSRAVWVNADLTRMAQAVANLLNNATKYTPEGGRILLSAERQREEAVVRVRDTGIGIPEEMLPHIFEMFRQVDTTQERANSGLGIGLTLVKNLVEMHGGTVAVHSDGVGRGSEFVLRLPLAKEMAKPASDRRLDDPLTADSRRILVVDDNLDSAESLAMLLDHSGHRTRTAHDGLEAMEAAAEFRPDVMLLDIGMPKLNGYEVARRIRAEPWGERIVLVALTGWGQDEDRAKSREAGFDSHFVKPVEHSALTRLLAGLPPAPGSAR